MSSESAPSTNGASSTTTPPTTSLATTSDAAVVAEQTSTTDLDALAKGKQKDKQKQKRPEPQTSTTAENIAEGGAGAKLTGAQLKKQKQLEKQQRRAEKITLKGEQVVAEQSQSIPQAPQGRPDGPRRQSQSAGSSKQKDQLQVQLPHLSRKGSNQPPEPGTVRVPFQPAGTTQTQAPRGIDKRVPFVSHLYPPSRHTASLSNAPREIHPSVLTLALHLRSLTLCGSTSRTLALLLVLKRVINAYTTPPNTALSRHLTTYLSHQISFLSSARPLSIAQGNAIRWLKKLISQLDPDLEESEAKKFLCSAIDSFIREKVTLAGEVISTQASSRIEQTGETILVYGKSSLVERTLLHAAKDDGKKFRVVVVDSRPLFEGKNLTRGLLRAGMREGGELDGCKVVYTLISGLTEVLEQENITKCILGASGMLGNGALYSRCGTAMVAMMAREAKVPVIVVAETLKFTSKMAVDSLSLNEVGDADALVEIEESNVFTTPVTVSKENEAGKKGGGGKKKGGEDKDDGEGDEQNSNSLLKDWREKPNLFLLNLMYDVTPAEYLDLIICELGTLPPGAVPVVNGVHGGDE
ncbi:hypothetical protein H2198_006941 [Neophaeococcomyces mojaviensis]|uniref:Uncharacterized protein n=1 Tax=Neophaeococcomyces mojaviensis TaxID=3383035 RepID=A0ACC3A1L1_9EURO|nr:hypothetical protein H2198_006941 [Knufia sp. JES_112]